MGQRAWQRKDAQLLSQLYGFPPHSDEVPSTIRVELAMQACLATIEQQSGMAQTLEQQKALLTKLIEIGEVLQLNNDTACAKLQKEADQISTEQAASTLRKDTELLKKAGHYLSGTVS